jgi:hypothetical protein
MRKATAIFVHEQERAKGTSKQSQASQNIFSVHGDVQITTKPIIDVESFWFSQSSPSSSVVICDPHTSSVLSVFFFQFSQPASEPRPLTQEGCELRKIYTQFE